MEKDGKDVAWFLECFDYAYIDPSDVDCYSMVLLMLFPDVKQELCQRFVDAILPDDLSKRFYHLQGEGTRRDRQGSALHRGGPSQGGGRPNPVGHAIHQRDTGAHRQHEGRHSGVALFHVLDIRYGARVTAVAFGLIPNLQEEELCPIIWQICVDRRKHYYPMQCLTISVATSS